MTKLLFVLPTLTIKFFYIFVSLFLKKLRDKIFQKSSFFRDYFKIFLVIYSSLDEKYFCVH